MPEDFKQNYINQQKKQESERAARLAKIGMGTAQSHAASSPAKRNDAEYANLQARVRPQAQTVAPPRPTNAGAAPARPARPAQNPTRQTQGVAGTPRGANPARAVQSPARQPQGGANTARPLNRPTAPAVQRRNAPVRDDEDRQFKKNLSDDERRAMMFALTGKAEIPSDGGDVDLIDIGRVKSSGKSAGFARETAKSNKHAARYIGRFFAVIGTVLLFLLVSVYATVFVIAHGPSESMRDLLVQSAEQASATKWVPYLVLSKDTVRDIINKSEEVVQDEISLDDYNADNKNNGDKTEDEWAKAKDGVIFETVNGSTYKAYVLLVRDPSRVFVGTSTDDFNNATAGVNIFKAAERYNALACINGGEFLDNGGHGSGYAPLGLTFSKGECVFNDGSTKTFMGFTKDNTLIVRESMTEKEAKELGIRDAVSFQNGNTLIEKNGDKLVMYYAEGNTGTSQRSAIGQRADGTVIMIVTDGRTASSPGATHNDMIDLMVSYGAVSAGMLDGGSSAMMFYRDYYDKYDIDKSKLDQYQLQGLVNNYKAFTEPRRIPTFFMVAP